MGMVRATFGIITCLAASATVFAQAAPPRAEFEVASIRPAKQDGSHDVDVDGSIFRTHNLTLKRMAAYGSNF